MYGTSYQCEHCGHNELTVEHTYVLRRAYESWISCACKKRRKDQIAAQHFYILPEIWCELGYLEDGRSKIYDRTFVDRLPVEGVRRLFHCEGCLDEASDYDWETEQVDEAEIVEGPDAWMMYCNHCKTEAQFGWTEPDRGGLIVPLRAKRFDVSQLWVDPGFRIRKQIRSQQRKARLPQGTRLIRPTMKKAGRGDGAKGLD